MSPEKRHMFLVSPSTCLASLPPRSHQQTAKAVGKFPLKFLLGHALYLSGRVLQVDNKQTGFFFYSFQGFSIILNCHHQLKRKARPPRQALERRVNCEWNTEKTAYINPQITFIYKQKKRYTFIN